MFVVRGAPSCLKRQMPMHLYNANFSSSREPPKKRQSLTELIAIHGPVFSVYWGTLYCANLAMIYSTLKYSGPELGMTIAHQIGLDKLITLSETSGTLAISIPLNEAFEFVRLPFVLYTLPMISKRWYSTDEAGMAKVGKSKREMIKQHGVFFVGYWTSLWCISGLSIYGGIELIGPDAVLNGLQSTGLDSLVDLNAINPEYYNIGCAVAINEILEIIRFPFSSKCSHIPLSIRMFTFATVATVVPLKRRLGYKV